MRNIPLVILGVVFTVLLAPILALQDGKVIVGVFGAVVLSSALIEINRAGAKKKLDDMLAIESWTPAERDWIHSKVEEWKAIFDQHLLLSVVLKIALGIAAALCAAPILDPQMSIYFVIVGWAITFGLVCLLFQTWNFASYVEKQQDRMLVESRNAAAREKEATAIREGISPKDRKAAPPEYQRVNLKIV